MPDTYAVIGNPIAHSRSPQIHTLFAEQTQQDLSYEKNLVEPERLEEFVLNFFKTGGCGLNVTVPFKEAVFELAVEHSKKAELAKAANTLYLNENGELTADNTDGPGIIQDIEKNLGLSLANASVLVLGAGGAVRGILAGLANQAENAKPQGIVIANRTLGKAQQLETEFSKELHVSSCEYNALSQASSQQGFDIIINGTSMGLSNQTPDISTGVVKEQTLCYDMVYSNTDTTFMTWAKNAGALKVSDGLGMLVEQAAEAFEIWRGVRPDTSPVIQALRE